MLILMYHLPRFILEKNTQRPVKPENRPISDEANEALKDWLNWKYNNPETERELKPDDLIFKVYNTDVKVSSLYVKVNEEYNKLLTVAEMDDRKDEGMLKRRKITLHTFRRFVKTVTANQFNSDYSEWLIGHAKSTYYTNKPEDLRELYRTKVMPYLTFLDYSKLESAGKNIEAQLVEKEKEISLLRSRDLKHETEMNLIREQQLRMQSEFEKLSKAVTLSLHIDEQFMNQQGTQPLTDKQKEYIRKYNPDLFK